MSKYCGSVAQTILSALRLTVKGFLACPTMRVHDNDSDDVGNINASISIDNPVHNARLISSTTAGSQAV